jgi:hypothetical protein
MKVSQRIAWLVVSGDLRVSANRVKMDLRIWSAARSAVLSIFATFEDDAVAPHSKFGSSP